MISSPLKIISSFIQNYQKEIKPVLIAFSGGPDSLALLHLLIEYKKKTPTFSFSIAHVDHGWREESSQELKVILEMANKLGISCHIKKLNPKDMRGNLEAACRKARLEFFSDLCKENDYQSVLFGHHADDLAETVLKRILEGASLIHLNGIKPVSQFYTPHNEFTMTLWRPLLKIKKTELLEWLEERNLKGFDDKTNQDTKFLRARLRLQILPELSRQFGKEVSSSLLHLNQEANELKEYLDLQMVPYLSKEHKSFYGSLLDLSKRAPIETILLKHLIRSYCNAHDFFLSRDALQMTVNFIMKKEANKKIIDKHQTLHIDRGRLFIQKQPIIQIEPTLFTVKVETEIKENSYKIITGPITEWTPPSNWLSLWNGVSSLCLPQGDYILALPTQEQLQRVKDWWTNHKIPTFLRASSPVLSTPNGEIYHEFLTGKHLSKHTPILNQQSLVQCVIHWKKT